MSYTDTHNLQIMTLSINKTVKSNFYSASRNKINIICSVLLYDSIKNITVYETMDLRETEIKKINVSFRIKM